MFRKIFSRRGQVGETVTWAVATLIIIVILLISVYLSGASDLAKRTLGTDKAITDLVNSNRIPQKSLFAFLATPEGDGIVYGRVRDSENFSEFEGNLAKDIFENFYEKEYPVGVWLGINFEGFGFRKNEYFGARPTNVRGSDFAGTEFVGYNSFEIKLSDNKILELVLMKK